MTPEMEHSRMSDETLNAFYEIADHVSKGDTVDETLASTVKLATALVSCDECCTYVRHGEMLMPWVWKHVKQGSLEPAAVPVSDGFAAALVTYRTPVAVCKDSVEGYKYKVFEEWSTRPGETFVCVPFMSRSRLLGAITLQHWQPHAYNRCDVKLLSSIGYVLGVDLGISRLEKENSELLLELETRKLVERSKGVLQRELGMTEHEAYLALQHQSQQKKRPLKEIAQAIILSAEVRQSVVQPE